MITRAIGLLTLSCIAMSAALPGKVEAEQPSEEHLLATAAERIETHRKADVVIAVVDGDGNPLPGAEVVVEQTRHAFLFGSNICQWGRVGSKPLERAYREQFEELLNLAVVTFNWMAYERVRGKPLDRYTEQVARWCKDRDILVKAHALGWNMIDPPWLPDDAEEIRRLQMARIDEAVVRFAGLIDRWEVINEATEFDRSPFRDAWAPKLTAMWRQVGQIEFVRQCFARARQAGPEAVLFINDFHTDPAYQRVIEQLVDADGNRMYDVIGIQSHMHNGRWSNRRLWDVCERFARFGVPLHFTEMTVLSGELGWEKAITSGRPWPSTPEGEAMQAREVTRVYTMLFSHPAVEAITWWDLSDYHAWQAAPAGLLRADMTPKPAYRELKKLIRQKWRTKATLQTGPDGTAAFRGFLGEYKVHLTRPAEQPTADKFRLVKGKENRWTVERKTPSAAGQP